MFKDEMGSIYFEENARYLNLVFYLAALFTVIGYSMVSPNEFYNGNKTIFFSNIFIIVTSILSACIHFFEKWSVAKAFSVVVYVQALVSVAGLLINLTQGRLTQEVYATEVILYMIYIAIVGFLVSPIHVFIYGGIAFGLNVFLLFIDKGANNFDMLPAYTSIIFGFSIAMYFFSKKSVGAFVSSYNNANTVLEQKKQIEELVKFRSEMSAMIVHDLKNPLGIIMVKSKDQTVRLAGQKMNNLIQNFLDVEKYENTKVKLNYENFLLNKQLEHSVRLMDHWLGEKNLVIEYNVNDNFRVRADKSVVDRILENILSNAVRHASLNSVIRIAVEPLGTDTIKVGVTNKGSKIPEHQIQHIFDKYVQLNGEDKFRKTNFGLGLAFCKMAIDAHGQTITAKNVPEDSVCFEFTLSLVGISEIENRAYNVETLSHIGVKILEPFVQKLNQI